MQKSATVDFAAWIGTDTFYAEFTYAQVDGHHFEFVAHIHSEDPATRQIFSFEAGRKISEIEYAADEAVDFEHDIKKLLVSLGVDEDLCTHVGSFSDRVARAADDTFEAVPDPVSWTIDNRHDRRIAAE